MVGRQWVGVAQVVSQLFVRTFSFEQANNSTLQNQVWHGWDVAKHPYYLKFELLKHTNSPSSFTKRIFVNQTRPSPSIRASMRQPDAWISHFLGVWHPTDA